MQISYNEFKRKQKEAFESGKRKQCEKDLKDYAKKETQLIRQYNEEIDIIREDHVRELKNVHNKYKRLIINEEQVILKKYKRAIINKKKEIEVLKQGIKRLQKLNKKYKSAVDLTFDLRHQLITTTEKFNHLLKKVLDTSTDLYQTFEKISWELEYKNKIFSKSEDKIREILLLE